MFNISRRNLVIMSIMVFVFVFAGIAGAQDTVSLDVETSAFIDAINQWLPLAISVVVIGVGISGAFALAQFVGDLITSAFRGR
jgi:hypothetical protein